MTVPFSAVEESGALFDENGKEVETWTSPYRLYWTNDGKLTTDQYQDDQPLVLACVAGGRVPKDAARASGLIDK